VKAVILGSTTATILALRRRRQGYDLESLPYVGFHSGSVQALWRLSSWTFQDCVLSDATATILASRRRCQDYVPEIRQDWSLSCVKAVILGISRSCPEQHNSDNLGATEATSRLRSVGPSRLESGSYIGSHPGGV
jgi:hypothetical protein